MDGKMIAEKRKDKALTQDAHGAMFGMRYNLVLKVLYRLAIYS